MINAHGDTVDDPALPNKPLPWDRDWAPAPDRHYHRQNHKNIQSAILGWRHRHEDLYKLLLRSELPGMMAPARSEIVGIFIIFDNF